MRRITRKPWFGPKRYFSWGWRIMSWQGGALLGAYVVLLVIDIIYVPGAAMSISVAVILTALFIYIALLTGDPPGEGGNSSNRVRS